MSANPHANGGLLMRELDLPDIRRLRRRGRAARAGATPRRRAVMGAFLRDVMRKARTAAISACSAPTRPPPTACRMCSKPPTAPGIAETLPYDDHLAPDGRVMEILSRAYLPGLARRLSADRPARLLLLLRGLHPHRRFDVQPARQMAEGDREIPWRRPIPSLNYLLTSHVWRQDHNGFSHQDPGFIDYVCNKKADIMRVYLPPDANSLLYVTDHCLRSWNRINVIVAGKQPAPQWLGMDEAIKHCAAGIGIWEWASNDRGGEPDVVMACAGDVPTLETLGGGRPAAAAPARPQDPGRQCRRPDDLQPHEEHPHGLTDRDFDALFTTDKPVIFAHHGYPWLIHRLTYRRTNHDNIHVRGYKEEGRRRRRSTWSCSTISTAFISSPT